MVSDGELFVYPPNKPRSLLAKFTQRDINAEGGVTLKFDDTAAKGWFNLYIDRSSGRRQVFGTIEAIVRGNPDIEVNEKGLYLRPINPPNWSVLSMSIQCNATDIQDTSSSLELRQLLPTVPCFFLR